MIDPHDMQAAVVAAGVAEVALTLHIDYGTVKEHRYALAETLIRFARAYVHGCGIADMGVDCEEYLGNPTGLGKNYRAAD